MEEIKQIKGEAYDPELEPCRPGPNGDDTQYKRVRTGSKKKESKTNNRKRAKVAAKSRKANR